VASDPRSIVGNRYETVEAFEIRRNRWIDDVSALLKKLDIALDPDEDEVGFYTCSDLISLRISGRNNTALYGTCLPQSRQTLFGSAVRL
jgi:hypothetical protein